MKVIFDFDDVIFNANGFKHGMVQVLESARYKNIMAMYEEYRSKDTKDEASPFSLRHFISSLDADLLPPQIDTLYERMIGFCEHLVDQEVLALIEQIGKENCYIVTNGVTDFQMDKIRRSVGEEGFAGVYVVSGSKKDVIAEICKKHVSEQVVFVDDKQKYFSDIDREACQNLQTVLFDRTSGVMRLKTTINEACKKEGKIDMFDMVPSSEVSSLH